MTHDSEDWGIKEFFQDNRDVFENIAKVICIYMIVQAVIGIIGIEYAWYRTRRFRKFDEERDREFPHFRRFDTMYWQRWKFYPGAMLVMPTRCMLLILDTLFLALSVR